MRKTVIFDASPLIFLAKVDELGLLFELFESRFFVLQVVVEEVLQFAPFLHEKRRLEKFLSKVEVVAHDSDEFFSSGLSVSDQATLSWALANQPDTVVIDERLLRRVAENSGLKIVGTLGILMQAARIGLRSPLATRNCIDRLIDEHNFRISITLYRRLCSELEQLSSAP